MFADRQYAKLVTKIFNYGSYKENRTGVDTLALFGQHLILDPSLDGFPLLTTKKISWKNILVENLWFLSGEPTDRILEKHGCKFWGPWRTEARDRDGNYYLQTEYGPNWNRSDQLRRALRALVETPDSRRMVVSAWNPETSPQAGLPPCHFAFVLNVNPGGTLNLQMTQRSADVAIGVPYNIAGYAFLQQLFAHIAGLKVGILDLTFVDTHVYIGRRGNHKCEYSHEAGLREQLKRDYRDAPRLVIDPAIRTLDDVLEAAELPTAELLELFRLEGYDPHPAIPFKVAV